MTNQCVNNIQNEKCILCDTIFIKEIEKLPEYCNILEIIREQNNFIYSSFNTFKSINSNDTCINFLNDKIKKANKDIFEILQAQEQEQFSNTGYTKNRIALFLHLKEGVRFWNEQLNILSKKEIKINMENRLLSNDYNNIIIEAFKLKESDYFKYYLSIIEKYYDFNKDIINELKLSINIYIEWYKTKVYSFGQTWACDENGENPVLMNPEEAYITLLEFGINMQVNRVFFDNHIEQIKIINTIIELKENLQNLENLLYEPLKSILKEEPKIKGFDLENIKNILNKFNNMKKIYCFNLGNLTFQNVETIYNRNFDRWRYKNSHEVIVKGEKIEQGTDRWLLMLPNENGEPNIETCVVSDTTKDGFPLTESLFIDEEINIYEPLYTKSIGDITNRDINLKLKCYIDFLKQKQKDILKPSNKNTNFKSKIIENQKQQFIILINDIHLFTTVIDVNIFNQILDCTLKTPLQINNNRHLAYFFDALYNHSLIDSKYWQSIIEKNKLFLSENNNLLKANDLAVANNYNKTCLPDISTKIDKAIREIKKQ
jgi:hypothetical protein